MKNNLFVLLPVLLLLGCKQSTPNGSRVATLPYYKEATFTPHWITTDDKSLDTFHRIPSFKLTNQDGELVTEETFKNKIYVVDFFFTTCPGICPKMTANMVGLQDSFLNDDEILLLSHSVTPSADSVSVLKDYAIEYGVVSKKWHLVTGSQKEIYDLGRKSYFVEEDLGIDKKDDEFLHTENFVLIDKNRHIRGIYNGLNKTSIKQLVVDIKTLKDEI